MLDRPGSAPANIAATRADDVYGDVRPDGVVWRYQHGDWTWLHLDLVNAAARKLISDDASWPVSIRRLMAAADETPRILMSDDVVGGVLPTFARTSVIDDYEVAHWHFAGSPTRLITARRHASRSLAATYHVLRGGAPSHGTATVIAMALSDFARAARGRLATLAGELDGIEDGLLGTTDVSPGTDVASRIGQARREAVMLRRALAPISRALDDGDESLPSWFQSAELDTAHTAILGVLDDITALNDRGRSLQDELTSRQADDTNRRLYLVSVMTALVMPTTFVTGFFGMNTGGLLWSGEGQHLGTIYAALACVATVALTLVILRWKRLL